MIDSIRGIASCSENLAVGMVKTIEITNFRAFSSFKINDLAQVNVIVGDNGVGKTALLEAFYLAVSSSAQNAMTVKQWRGMNMSFQTGSGDSVVEGIYSDLFHDPDAPEPIQITLTGRDFENRKLVIEKARGDVVVPTAKPNRQARRAAAKVQRLDPSQAIAAPISLTWTDQGGGAHKCHVLMTPMGLQFEGTGEKIPICYMFAANTPASPEEAATIYSALRRRREHERFRAAFFDIFEDIIDIQVETSGGTSVLSVDVPWAKQLIPLPVLSGGTTRASAILLALTSRLDGLVLVDEVENGIYHRRQKKMSAAMLRLAREYGAQLIMTTHSDEWIGNFLESVGQGDDDIAFWRMERSKDQVVTIRRFTVEEFSKGFALGEMR